MKKHWSLFAVSLLLILAAPASRAGTISYQAIPAQQSDANCGIGNANQYTSAVDGGHPNAPDRVINGITLYSMNGSGQSVTVDGCTLNALSGSLTNTGPTAAIQADGVFQGLLADATFNQGAADNSQQEIVLDPEGLTAGTTYDLRIYVYNLAGQDRQVSLAFFGDGGDAAETGFFNEDDARTSPGKFQDPNQAYFINYRFTWDGDSTPGITITQKTGAVPFVLYALTNQVVPAEGEGLTTGLVNAESDEVGVSSDDFYTSESLNTHGKWVKLDKWGTCWQPSKVASGWCPYTNGSWRECDDCGWTFVSDEPWAWACYHYGRWAKVKVGCGWVWVPGKVWAPSWVSWRQGKDESCIGWAPLPPEASCEINVGVSTWVDRTCDIGPECYVFVNLRDFGSDSYWGCGCIYERSRNIVLIIETFNITNICYNRGINIWCGGPNRIWCNERIRKFGGKEVGQIFVKRYDNVNKLPGGKHSHLDGNQLALVSPNVKGGKNSKHNPKIAETLGRDKVDGGWGGVNKNKQKELRDQIATQSKGKDPKTDKATLPPDVAQKIGKHHGDGKGQHAGGVNNQTAGGDQHPSGKRNKDQKGAGAGGTNAAGGKQGGGRHPGQKKSKGTLGGMGAGAADGGSGSDKTGGGGKGQGKKGQGGDQTGVVGQTGQDGDGGRAQTGNKGKKKNQGDQGTATGNAGNAGKVGGGRGQGGKGNKHQKGVDQGGFGAGAGSLPGGSGTGGQSSGGGSGGTTSQGDGRPGGSSKGGGGGGKGNKPGIGQGESQNQNKNKKSQGNSQDQQPQGQRKKKGQNGNEQKH